MSEIEGRNGFGRFEEASNPRFANGSVGNKARHSAIAKSLSFIDRNFCRPVAVPDMAKASGLSIRGFHKAFRQHTGLSPGDALRRLRIEHAKRLLLEEDLTLAEIAKRCGFSSANTFWVAFRQMTGFGPKQFQRQAMDPGT